MAEAETAGLIEPGERAMIAGVMRLGDRPVRAVMTPRREVDMVDLTADPDDIRRTIVESIHSRLPAHAGTPEEMLGVVQAKDLLDAYLRDQRPDIRAQVRPAANVPDTADALDVVDVIKGSLIHMALVHDEYGHFQGVVTNADILEAIVGDFRTDEGPVEPDAVQRDDGSWLIAGSMPIDEMTERLSIALPPDAAITRLRASFSISSVNCQTSAKAFIIKAGGSRSSISMAVALTRFWPVALLVGDGAQPSKQILAVFDGLVMF
jgi:putative hemolysin